MDSPLLEGPRGWRIEGNGLLPLPEDDEWACHDLTVRNSCGRLAWVTVVVGIDVIKQCVSCRKRSIALIANSFLRGRGHRASCAS